MMLREALNCRNSLRREFEEFIQPMVPGGINWLEVDSVINVLTRTKAPPEKLTRMGLRPAQHIRDESYSDYRVYSQERACQLPILMHGATGRSFVLRRDWHTTLCTIRRTRKTRCDMELGN